MSTITNRSSVLAVNVEVTEGTLVFPSAAGQYVALQPDFDYDPSFESLENLEQKSSIAPSKPTLGLEQPKFSFSHYLRHSGTEGTAPDYQLFLRGLFGNAASAQGTQRTTTSSSTTSVVKLAAGGSDYAYGKAMLVKDSANGYSIRNVLSVATNDVTLAFDLPGAPASGVTCGKYVNFSPANSGHPTLSLVLYRGNGGLVEAMAGGRVTEMTVEIDAGKNINAKFTVQGTKYFFNPIEITSTTKYIDWTDDTGTFAASIVAQVYRDPVELADAIAAAMDGANSAKVHSVVYSHTTGAFTISCTGTVLSLLWNTGTNTANSIAAKIGFSTAADDTGTAATTGYTGSAFDAASPYTPTYDNADVQVAKGNELLLGDATDTTCLCASKLSFRMSNVVDQIPCICATSGIQGYVINKREVECTFTALVEKYDASKFVRFRKGQATQFAMSFGTKSGGNWVAGTCANIFCPTVIIDQFKVADQNGLAVVEGKISGYADATSGASGEVFVNFL